MGIEDDISHKMSMQIQREVDREILWSMLKELGWTRVMIPRNSTLEINYWLANNCKGAYEWHDRDFIFKDPKDASHFILKWL